MREKAARDLDGAFKTCPVCNTAWHSRADFLSDSELELIGYQVSFRDFTAGIFLFNHTCKGTLAIRAQAFRDLYEGPIFSQRAIGTSDCPGHCLHESDLDPCSTHCECAYVREIMQIIKNWPDKKPYSKK